MTIPVLGSSLPISPARFPVNQMLPSLSSTSPCGPREGRLERIFPDRTRLRIDPAKLVGELSAPPDRAIARGERIVRTRSLCRHVPHLDIDFHRTIDEDRLRPLALRKILHEIVGHRAPFLGGNGRLHVLHHAHDGQPALGRVAAANPVDVVAAVAGVDEALLARAFRPILCGVLRMRDRGARRITIADQTGQVIWRATIMLGILPSPIERPAHLD